MNQHSLFHPWWHSFPLSQLSDTREQHLHYYRGSGGSSRLLFYFSQLNVCPFDLDQSKMRFTYGWPTCSSNNPYDFNLELEEGMTIWWSKILYGSPLILDTLHEESGLPLVVNHDPWVLLVWDWYKISFSDCTLDSRMLPLPSVECHLLVR